MSAGEQLHLKRDGKYALVRTSRVSRQQLDKWADRWERAICREIRGRQVYYVCGWRAAGGGHVGLRFIVMRHPPSLPPAPPPPPFPSSGGAGVLGDEIWKVSHFLCRAVAPQLLVSAPLPPPSPPPPFLHLLRKCLMLPPPGVCGKCSSKITLKINKIIKINLKHI